MTMKKPPIGLIIGIIVAIGLITLIVRSATGGPSTVPNARDVKQSQREEKPENGADERTLIPTGNFVAGNGVVEPADRETKVAGELSGRIASIAVKEGDLIERNAVLAELESSAERAALASAEADADTARVELSRTLRGLRKEDVEAIVADTESMRAKAELSKGSLERTQALATRGAATPDELDRARRQAETDQRMLEASEARRRAAVAGSRAEDIMVARRKVTAAMARVEQARANLERLTIRSPIAGEVLQLKYRAGEYYTPASEPIAVLGDTRSLRVRVDVDERDVPRLAVGAAAFATLNAFPNQRFSGRVVEIGRRMGRKNIRSDDPTERIDTKILEVVFELDNKAGLVPGLRVIGYIEARAQAADRG